LQESGDWEDMIAEGVATDATDNDAFMPKPRGFAKFEIGQLEKN